MSGPAGESGWVIGGTIFSGLTLAVTLWLARRERVNRRVLQDGTMDAALYGLDRELRDLTEDARRAIASVTYEIPAVPGFRLRTEELTAHFEASRAAFSAEQETVIDYVLRQASDANRAMDTAQAVHPASAERIRQYRLVNLKASHLFEANEHDVTHIQRAQNAVIAVRRQRRGELK